MHVTLPTGSAANARNTPVTSVVLLGKTETQRQRMDPKESVWSAEYCLQSACLLSNSHSKCISFE